MPEAEMPPAGDRAPATVPFQTIRTSILRRIVWKAILISALSLALLSGLSFLVARSLMTQRLFSQLSSLTSSREDFLEESMQTNRLRTALFASRPEPRLALEGGGTLDALYEKARREIETLRGMTLFDGSRRVVLSHGERSPVPFFEPSATTLIPSIDRRDGWQAVDVYSPVRTASGEVLGTLALQYDVGPVLQTLFGDLSLGETAEVTLGREQGGEVSIIHHSRREAPFHTSIVGLATEPYVAEIPLTQAVQGQEGMGIARDEDGKTVLAAYRFVPSLNMGIVVKLESSEAFAGVKRLGLSLALLGAFLIGLTGFFMFFFARTLTAPLLRLAGNMSTLGPGHWDFSRSVHTGDEVELLDHVIAELTGRLKGIYENLEAEVEERTGELQQQHALDRAILDHIPYGVLVLDPEGRVRNANPAAAKLLFRETSQMLGMAGVELLQFRSKEGKAEYVGDDHPVLRCLRERTVFHSPSLRHTSLERQDATLLPTMLAVTPLLEGDHLLGAIAVFLDLTEERQTDYVKSEFISLVSHQLRTPLSSMLWYLEILHDEEKSPLSEKQRDCIGEIETAARRMEQLVETVLRVSRLEEGGVRIEKKEVDIVAVTSRYLTEMQSLSRENGISCTALLPKTPLPLVTDSVLVGIVLQNIFTNAVKYSHPGGEIQVELRASGEEVEIVVQDQGLGIPARDQPNIFRKFFRAANVRNIQVNGTGLGLYISRTIARRLGGELTFTSEEGKGTTFFFTLPLRQSVSDAQRGTPPSPPPPGTEEASA